MNFNILKDLCYIPSPSNFEEDIVKYIRDIKPKNFIYSESNKNSCLYYYKKSDNAKTILIDAHIDQVHLRAVRVNEEGLLVASPLGFKENLLYGNDVVHIKSGMRGTVLTPAPHLKLKDNTEKPNNYIDFGMTKVELERVIKPGDPILFHIDYFEMNNKYIVSTGLDDKAGSYILLELLDYFDKNIDKLKCNLILHFSSREETGLGSFSNIEIDKIDEIIVIDTDFSTDNVFMNSDMIGEQKMDKGPTITRNNSDDISLGERLIVVAKKYKIPYQLAYSSKFGGTNGDHYTKFFDSLTQFVGIPLKNMHSPIEVVSKKDLKNIYLLMRHYITN